MESRPADELILLAVQSLLKSPQPSTSDRMIAATILESAMQYSPYNPHLKICAIHVFGELEAPSRSWELFNDLHIKHIQYESCAFLILPILRSGGMFHETILVCREILGLHLSSARDVPDYVGRAMEVGNLSKAEEFLLFHRNKMTKSLTTLEAKGLILDMAPLLVDENDGIIAVEQGIVGADSDFDRVKQMVAEAHNPNGVFSLLQVHGSFMDLLNNLSDNRDFSVLYYEILWKRQCDTVEIILSESLRRGHQHNLLIRSALCIEATNGPKKGKVIKPNIDLQKRCLSLLKCASTTDSLLSSIVPSACNAPFLVIMRELCIVIVALSSGLDSTGEFVLETLVSREVSVCTAINRAIESLQMVRNIFKESNDMSISRISRMTADSIVTVFALFEMVAKIVDLFGWGRRKQKTKRCAASVAEFALLYAAFLTDMLSVLER
jgi:N-terminal acetyltransferase B complex non-catalytic subunit